MTPITNLISKVITESATAEDFFAVSNDLSKLYNSFTPYFETLEKFGILVTIGDSNHSEMYMKFRNSTFATLIYSLYSGRDISTVVYIANRSNKVYPVKK